jgi:alpha-L-rhamnosidase
VTVSKVRFEHHREAIGIGERRPRISWKVLTDDPGWSQCAYEVEVEDTVSGSTASSGRVEDDECVLAPWPGSSLGSRDRRAVRVRVWGPMDERPSAWSEPAHVEAGLLEPGDWTARLITPHVDDSAPDERPPALFRREFLIAGDVVAARLYATAHGVYQAEINGLRVGDHVLAPGWTSYHHRLRYQTFDVTSLLRVGGNTIGIVVGDGWFRGHLGFHGGQRDVYGDHIGAYAQLEVRFADGTLQQFVTDEHWRSARGPIRTSGIYAGETYDAREERTGWSAPGHGDGGWAGVRVRPLDVTTLVAPAGPPIRRMEELKPVAITTSISGRTLVDFGQNLVGRLRIRVKGPAGTTVTLRHAEVVVDGELCTRPLRSAAATDSYTLRGDDAGEEWEPMFTFHGFRYAEVSGWPGELHADDVRAVVIHSDMERTGWFECSDPLVTRLHENVVWSMRGNFVDIPTDCPQRDERLGWTGDIAAFVPTASFLYDCAGLLSSWLRDLALEQQQYGTVPHYVPWVPSHLPATPTAAWGDAAVIVPWVLYQRFTDQAILEAQYASMTAWVDQVASIAGDSHLWDAGFQFGDWLDPAAPPERPSDARTDPYLIATAYHALTARIVAETAALLGREEDYRRYAELATAVRAAFCDEFVSASGHLLDDTQTAYALALGFDLLPTSAQRERAGRRLAELVAAEDHRIGTGFVGTPVVCDALTMVGELDAAYGLLMQRECPSWLYPVTMGATTVWERWDSLLPDGRVNPGQMTSFNHYAFGAVADWLHRTVVGLAPAAVGYRRVLVEPHPGGGLTHARAAHETPYGRVEVAWRRNGGSLDVEVTVPPGITALVRLPQPGWTPVEVGGGHHAFGCSFRRPEQDPGPPRLAPTAAGV